MAKWVRGRTFGTSMCDTCNYEIPYDINEPDPDECPKCGAYMENGFGNIQKALETKLLIDLSTITEIGEVEKQLGRIRENVIPEEYTVGITQECSIWEKAFQKYIDVNGLDYEDTPIKEVFANFLETLKSERYTTHRKTYQGE